MNDRSGRERIRGSRRAQLPEAGLEATPRRILEVALRMFATDGFHATSMRDLAKVLEIQPSALYASFPSKDHLLGELVRIGHEVHHTALRGALLRTGPDPVEQLRAVVCENARFHAAFPHLAIVINDELHALAPDLAAAGLTLRRQSIAILTDIITRGIALEQFTMKSPEVACAAIGAMSLRIPHWYEPGTLDTEALADAQAELALRMVGA